MIDRPQEIRTKRMLGNWRVKSAKHVSKQRRREGNDDAYLALIRQLHCCVCGAQPPNDPHHLKSAAAAAERAFGRRSTDRHCVPLCRTHHDLIEAAGSRGELELFKDWHVDDPHGLAERLWKAPHEVFAMRKIVSTWHWGEK